MKVVGAHRRLEAGLLGMLHVREQGARRQQLVRGVKANAGHG
jgi:hypothetical protein